MLAAACQACAFGCRPVEMTYDGDVLHVAPIALAAPLHFVLVDLRAAKDTVIILSRLQVQSLHMASTPRSVLAENTIIVLSRRHARLLRRAFFVSSCQPGALFMLCVYRNGRHKAAFALQPSSSEQRGRCLGTISKVLSAMPFVGSIPAPGQRARARAARAAGRRQRVHHRACRGGHGAGQCCCDRHASCDPALWTPIKSMLQAHRLTGTWSAQCITQLVCTHRGALVATSNALSMSPGAQSRHLQCSSAAIGRPPWLCSAAGVGLSIISFFMCRMCQTSKHVCDLLQG